MAMASRSKEDYLEAIHWLIEKKGHARTKDIAAELKVKPPSVTEMLSKLDGDGLVRYEKYGGVSLTKKGRTLAVSVKSRHNVFREFLIAIGVPERTAEQDACVMEHNLHKKTIDRIRGLVSSMHRDENR